MFCKFSEPDFFNTCHENLGNRHFHLLLMLLLPVAGNCNAGPPLVTDDPGVLDPGTWEVIIGTAGVNLPDRTITDFPLLDISYGIGTDSQVSFLLPHTVFDTDTAATESGLGQASMALKWRLVSAPHWELAIAPSYTMPVSGGLKDPDNLSDVRVFGLPLLASYTHGDWTWNGQLALNLDSEGGYSWDYGLSLSHPLGGSLCGLAEVYGNASTPFDDSTLHYNIGLDYEIHSDWHLLAAVGKQLTSWSEPGYEFTFYAGLQWFH